MDGHGQCRSQSLQKPDGGKLRDCDQHGDGSDPERGDTSNATVPNHSLNVTDTPLNYIQGEYQISSQSQEQKEPFEHSLQVSRHSQDGFTVQIQGQKTVFSSQVYDATGHVRPVFYQWSPLHDDTVKSEGNSSVPGIYRRCSRRLSNLLIRTLGSSDDHLAQMREEPDDLYHQACRAIEREISLDTESTCSEAS